MLLINATVKFLSRLTLHWCSTIELKVSLNRSALTVEITDHFVGRAWLLRNVHDISTCEIYLWPVEKLLRFTYLEYVYFYYKFRIVLLICFSWYDIWIWKIYANKNLMCLPTSKNYITINTLLSNWHRFFYYRFYCSQIHMEKSNANVLK